ncbi:MAG TPA: YjbE family putative metal transport protein, partial [Azospirillaceae bacterium]|nr:YjbE family putative metal transport protein [Azospirillaceae bacterium]
RAKVIFWGIAAAVVLRIMFAAVTTQLLAIIGLTFAGGILLLWVCWKLFRELRQQRAEAKAAEAVEAALGGGVQTNGDGTPVKTVGQAIWQVVVADVSMSLDNVLAVAGAAREHLWVLVVGLILSVGLMGAAASLIARLLEKHHWIAYIGLVVITYVALTMLWHGGAEILMAAQLT